MKSKDTIRLFGNSLYIQYGMTGELQSVSSLRLDQGVTFTRDGDAITARYHNAVASFPIERFASDALASSAYQHLQQMVQRHSRQRRQQRPLSPARGFCFGARCPPSVSCSCW